MGLKQLESHEYVVGDRKFHITPFPALKAANLTGELASVLAPLLGCLAPLVVDDGGLGDIDVSVAANALSGCSSINGDKLEALMVHLLLGGNIVVDIVDDNNGTITHERLTRDLADEIFCGDVQDMFIIMFYVITINFGGFFKRLGNRFGEPSPVTEETMN